ncbi:MAG TPA: S8 family serine peptidase [Flavobacteriales bacterium]|nr:S8 family serine peptidase [Flavobacteriales bacterium]
MTLSTPFRTLILATALTTAPMLLAQEAAYIPGDILLMLEPGASARSVVNDLAFINGQPTGLRVVKEVSAPMRAWLLHYDNPALRQAEVMRQVGRHPGVTFAQNNHVVKDRAVPNDPQYGQQWQHQNIDSEAAWDITTGGLTATGDTIVVCIIENADLPHPDLVANAWYNHQEIASNSIDDDGNGYVDDFQGWNPGGNNDDVYGGGHGTQVAGMIGAVGDNGSQVAGANWDVKMMVVTRDGIGEAAVVESYTYPLVMRRRYNETNGAEGAFVVATNASWGIDNADPAGYPIWCAMYDTLGAAGVLNCGATANNNVNIDVVGDMPTACASDFMVSVTATNTNDMRTFSGYGATTVDLGAPGENIFTTSMGGGTGSTSGTSFASPLTAGVIALLYSAPCATMMGLVHADPEAGALYVRQALFTGVEQVGNLPGNTVTGGRVNSNNSLLWIMSGCGTCPAPYNLSGSSTALGEEDLVWSSTVGTTFNVRYRPVGSTDWVVVNDVPSASLTLQDLDLCAAYEYQVEAQCEGETSGWSASWTFTSEGCCTVPTSVTAEAVDTTGINVQWSVVLAANTYDIRYALAGTTDWTTVAGLSTSPYAITGLEGCNEYEVQMRTSCDGITTTDWSASTLVMVPGCGVCVDLAFCPSVSASTNDEWIDRVRIGAIDNTSGNNEGYALFATESTTLDIGTPTPVILTPGYDSDEYAEAWTIWLDLDLNGQFEAPGERVFQSDAVAGEVTGNLLVPETAPVGPTRMRVIMEYFSAAATGCENDYNYGETEDYCVTIAPASGLTAVEGHGTSAYPNPADDAMTIALPGAGRAVIEVLDNTGRMAMRTSADGPRAWVTTSNLAEGLYLYRVMVGGRETARGKFQVAH